MAALDGGIMSDAESRVTDWVQSQQRVAEQGNRETDPMAVMMLLEVDRLRLKLGQLLQEGTFGRVYQVRLQGALIEVFTCSNLCSCQV